MRLPVVGGRVKASCEVFQSACVKGRPDLADSK